MAGKKGEKALICPRCGLPISWIERHRKGDRVYLVAVHYLGYTRTPDGRIKKRVKKCYLGPEDRYEYVSRLHDREGLVLRGLSVDRLERALEYLDALIAFFSRPEALNKARRDQLLGLAERLEKLAQVLRSVAQSEERREAS